MSSGPGIPNVDSRLWFVFQVFLTIDVMGIDIAAYNLIRAGKPGFYSQDRGLLAVWGGEADSFLDGLVSNNIKKLEEGIQILAAFPNAQGRLLAVAGIRKQEGKFLVETEEATREKVFQYLHRFTYAGDFFIADISQDYRYFEFFGLEKSKLPAVSGALIAKSPRATGLFVPSASAGSFRELLISNGSVEINDELYETFRIESGIPKYGVDIDEQTIVPEIGIEEMISYDKGCYIGQEIIARIHFRGHVAKKMAGLIFTEAAAADSGVETLPGRELKTTDGRIAGRITSAVFSPSLGRTIALAFVRFDFLGEGTRLLAGDAEVSVKSLPFMPVASSADPAP